MEEDRKILEDRKTDLFKSPPLGKKVDAPTPLKSGVLGRICTLHRAVEVVGRVHNSNNSRTQENSTAQKRMVHPYLNQR